jgi:hypothetical protein
MKRRLILAAALMLATFALIHEVPTSHQPRSLSNADASLPAGSRSSRPAVPNPSKVAVRPAAARAVMTDSEALRGFRDWAEQHATTPMPGEIRWLLEEKVDARGDLLVTAVTPGPGKPPSGHRAVWTEVHLDDGREFDAYLYGNQLHRP